METMQSSGKDRVAALPYPLLAKFPTPTRLLKPSSMLCSFPTPSPLLSSSTLASLLPLPPTSDRFAGSQDQDPSGTSVPGCHPGNF